MSRSYKKSPVGTCAKIKGVKQRYNRRIRHSRDENSYKSYKKRNCSWEICEYKEYNSKPVALMEDWEKKAFLRK